MTCVKGGSGHGDGEHEGAAGPRPLHEGRGDTPEAEGSPAAEDVQQDDPVPRGAGAAQDEQGDQAEVQTPELLLAQAGHRGGPAHTLGGQGGIHGEI